MTQDLGNRCLAAGSFRRARRLGWLAILVWLFFPVEEVLAWGPAVHIGLGGRVLSELATLTGAVAALLFRNRLSYLYGSIAADIVFAKRLSRVKQFCHHWSTAFQLLDTAEDESGRAFAYGYLSHLAADTVAHGKFVPYQVLSSGTTVRVGHLFWELRADSMQGDSTWDTLDWVINHDHGAHHRALETHIQETFLSYGMNRLLFDNLNALAVRRGFRRSVSVMNRCSRWYLSPCLVRNYEDECVDRILSVLSEGAGSSVLHEDPNGTSALMSVCVHRRDLRRLRRRGLSVHQPCLEATRGLAPTPRRIVVPSPPRVGTRLGLTLTAS